MKKLLKLVGLVVIVLFVIVGKFYYTVYASEYEYCVGATEVVEPADGSLKVGTYNIKSMNYGEPVELFQQDIEGLDLDVIVLQEVDRNSIRSGDIDMVKELAEVGGYEYSQFYSTMWILNGYYGLGILSKYPITEVESELLPNSLIKEPRILTKTTIRVGQEDINIFNTHLTYENNEIRVAQLNYVRDRVEEETNAILAGDFNSFGMNGELTIDSMQSINANREFLTFRSMGAPDDIFYSSNFTVSDAQVRNSSFSDHNLLYATFNY